MTPTAHVHRRTPWRVSVAVSATMVSCTVAALLLAAPVAAAPTGYAQRVAADAGCTESQSGAALPTTSSGTAAVRTMMGVAQTMQVPRKGQIIAVMVMLQESSIRNLANDGTTPQVNWPAPGRDYWISVTKLSLKYPHDKFGSRDGAHDTDSIGLYQQRPAYGWGNYGDSTGLTDPEGVVQRLLDPRWEAMAFFGGTRSAAANSGLLDVAGWQNMAPTDAAEAVQGSTQGDLYAKWEPLATDYVDNNQNAPVIGLPWAAYPGGGRGSMSCTSIPVDPNLGEAGHNPRGYLDNVWVDDTTIRVAGWSFDPDAINGTVAIRVTDTGPSGVSRNVDGLANLDRSDVAQAFGLVGRYGFDLRVPSAARGAHNVCVTATNIGRGSTNPQLGCVSINVLGPVGTCGGDPNNPQPSGVTAARTDAGTTVIVRGADDAVWLRPAGPAAGFQSLGGRIQFGPAVVSWGGNRLDLFAVGTDGRLYHQAGASDGSWNGWEDLGGALTASPAALSFTSNSLNVYARGTDGQLWTMGWTGTNWTSWQAKGGTLTSGTGGVVDPDTGRATVGSRDAKGNLTELRFDRNGGTSSVQVGAAICSAPAYASRAGDGDLRTLAFRAKDGSLTVGGTSVGGIVISAPALVLDPTGSGVTAFARGNDLGLWMYRGTPGSGSWSSLGGRLH